MTALVVIAKACLPGRVKTRLHPPLSLDQAAQVAAVSLAATLAAVERLPASRRVLFFDGIPDDVPAAAHDYEVMPQPTGSLDERLAHLFDTMGEPTVLIGMDTPQLAASDFGGVFERWPDDADGVFGPASDGGFWALGMLEPTGALVRGVPMSRSDTGLRQRERLTAAGFGVLDLPTLRDIDTIDDLVAVSRMVDADWPVGILDPATADGRKL